MSETQLLVEPGCARIHSLLLAVAGWDGQGQFELTLEGDEGAVYVVEASEDLVEWVILTTAVKGGSALVITDPDAASFSQRFYRARPLE